MRRPAEVLLVKPWEQQRVQRLASLGKLAAGIAHEINTPVQYVSDSVFFVNSSVEDLLEYCGALEHIARQMAIASGDVDALTRIDEARTRSDFDYVKEHAGPALERSVEGLSRVAEIAQAMKRIAHEDPRRRTSTDINQLLEDTLLVAACEYRFVAEVEQEYGELPPVICDRSALGQLFLNLLVNAADAVRERHEGTRNGLIRVRSELHGDKVHISFHDNGAGIPDDVRAHIFEPFFTTKEVGRGSGQGLALVAQVVRDHRGQVSVSSEPGVGTEIAITIPVQAARGH